MSNYNFENNRIIINFNCFPFCFRTISVDKYTNNLKDDNEFHMYFTKMMERDLPSISQYTFDDVTSRTSRHSHPITYNTDNYTVVIKVLKQIFKDYYKSSDIERDFELFMYNNINDNAIWQLGIVGGIRLIGTRNLNVFNVLFIDYHHLIWPDKNHNQLNYMSYSYCPIIKNGEY